MIIRSIETACIAMWGKGWRGRLGELCCITYHEACDQVRGHRRLQAINRRKIKAAFDLWAKGISDAIEEGAVADDNWIDGRTENSKLLRSKKEINKNLPISI